MMRERPNACSKCHSSPWLDETDQDLWVVKCSGCERTPGGYYPSREEARNAWITFNSSEVEDKKAENA